MSNPAKLKFGFLTERLLLGFGVDLVVDEQARRLAAMGYEVTVYTTQTDKLYERTGYSVVNLSEKLGKDLDPFSPHFAHQAIPYLGTRETDIWVIHSPPFYDWFTYLPAPAILWEHGTPDGHFFTGKLSRSVDRLRQHRYLGTYGKLRPADRVVAISEYIRRDLPENVQPQSVTIHNGGDHYAKATDHEVQSFREKYGIDENRFTVLWVGRISLHDDWQPYKGLQEMFQIQDWLKERYPEAQLVVVGKADDEAVATLRGKGIIPAPNLPKEEMPAAYKTADVYLNTSKWEGFNLALVEAQYQGTTVIAYKIGAHPEVVAHMQSGVLVDNLKELKQSLSRMIETPSFRERLELGSIAHAQKFTWDRNAEQLAALSMECITARGETAKDNQPKSFPAPWLPYKLWRYQRVADQLGWGYLAKLGFKSMLRKLGLLKT